MARKQTVPPAEIYEERESNNKLFLILGSITLYGLAVLLMYIAVATPEPGTAMGAIRAVLAGLGGSLSWLIPVYMGYTATLVAIRAASRRVSVFKSIMDTLLFICFFALIHVFFADAIVRERMTISGFANFVSKSYGYGHGGGAIGALLAWYPYDALGKVGAVMVILLFALLLLTATGRMAKFIRWSSRSAKTIQHNADQHRRVRNIEQMFDVEEPEVRKPAPRRRSDPMSDELYPPRNAAPVKKARPVHMEPERPARAAARVGRTMGATAVAEEPVEKIKSEPAKKRKMYRENVKEQPEIVEETILDEVSEEPDFGIVHTEPLNEDAAAKRKAARKKAHKPDTSASVEAMRTMKAKDGQIRLEDEDYTIEPDQCDVLEGDDEPPFDIPEKPKKAPAKMKRPAPTPPPSDDEEEYFYPPIDLLAEGDQVQANHKDADMEKARLLEETLHDFGISSKLTGIAHGPAVTRFELQPAPGVKVSRITSLSDDIAMRLAAMSVRIEAPIPGKAAVGVEIPNDKVEMVRLRDVLESSEARKSASKIAVGLGKDNSGRYIVADIAKMPHVLIAGQTGSGKSVCINSIITSILFRATPDEVRLILIDPKVVELSIYNDIPHLVCPVVTDCKKAASALDWAVAEMSKRYKMFAERGVRDIKGYNKALNPGEKIMPQMVIIIDELADLMMVAPGEVEDSICRLAQLARAAGMHLVIATQRPSVNVITGIIKANIPTRIAFSVASQIDSRTMIDHGGAEKLLGNGDMLFVPNGINKPMRVQGAWVSDEEVHAVVTYIKDRSETAYDADMIEKMDNAARSDAEKEEFNSEYDPRLPEAVEIVVEAGQASVSMLQRRMRVGYARAGRLIDEMEQRGIVSEADGAKPRTVLITRDDMEDLFEE